MKDENPMDHEDEDLKLRFAALRRENERRAIDYTSIRARRTKRSDRDRFGVRPNVLNWWKPGLTIALTAAAAVALWLSIAGERAPQNEPWAAGQWAMPTDVLLDLSTFPGDHLLHEFPEIGTLPVEAPDGAQNPPSNRRTPV